MAYRTVRYRRKPRRGGDDDDIRSRIDAGSPGRGGAQGGQTSASSRSPGRSTSSSGGNAGARPIGVPRGYSVLAQRTAEQFRMGNSGRTMSANAIEAFGGVGAPYERRPRYFDGDQYRPASQPVESIINRQRALVLGGFLDFDEEFIYGVWDEPTTSAYERLLGAANAAGLTAEQMLQRGAMGVPSGGGGGSGPGGSSGGGGYTIDPETGEMIVPEFVPPPLELSTTNQQDLERVFRASVVDKLGVGWNSEQVKRAAEAYRWMEIQLQTQAYDQEVARMEQEFNAATEGGVGAPGANEQITQDTILEVSPPSPDTWIENKLREENPEEWQTNEGLELLMPLLERWGGGGSIA